MTATITTEQARDLAVAYSAWNAATRAKDDLGIVVWGEALLESQRTTGVEIAPPRTVEGLIGCARNRRQLEAA